MLSHLCNNTFQMAFMAEGRQCHLPVPMIWREPTNHIDDCYFCMVPPVSGGFTRNKREQLNTLTYHMLCNLSHMAKDSQFMSLLQIFLSVQTRTISLCHIILFKRQRQHVVAVGVMMTFRALMKHLLYIKLPGC
ncbi:hypothetical protein AVEN_248222-1 [Araneus ventricosus]|uniref:Uncharacterized protein n=1 Tax=Araneus ventricosus TaxID=182803 RepID=A0A4Y2UH88_ARAVE|nr:hypothetical protein AVEN_248222-1 [Araneus ventricosus]